MHDTEFGYKGPGRPTKPRHTLKRIRVSLRFTESQYDRILAAALRKGQKIQSFIDEAIERILKEAQ